VTAPTIPAIERGIDVRASVDHAFTVSPRPCTRVEVRFTPTGSGTCRVELTHAGWAAIDRGAEVRGAYDSGWPRTLALLATAAQL
jgi:hypothetical protein